MANKNNKGFDREAALRQIMGGDFAPNAHAHDVVDQAEERPDVRGEREIAPKAENLTGDAAGPMGKKAGRKSKMPADGCEAGARVKRCYYLSPNVIEALRRKCYDDPSMNASGHVEAALLAYLGL